MRRHAFTLIEMLVAMAILGVVMGVVSQYLVRQNELTRQAQAKSEVQDKVRTIMQLITQDLQLAGASQYVSGNGATSNLLSCPGTGCLSGSSSDVKDSLDLSYVTSLRTASEACRRVSYTFSGSTLQRVETTCGSPLPTPVELASNILAVDVQYVCSNGNKLNNYPDTTNCDPKYAYPRSARVSVVGRSDAPYPSTSSSTYRTLTGEVTCPSGFVCYAMEQEVLLPNFKNQ
ncbi:PilW family protein [Calidithermus chliarophilus]|uniref:PilW family protein n=1 Tax=Calidithermus chliarophilus TaxID=52023 RepID=UPI00041A8EA7|nr:type II secretion system protein [Calidithermus chliarophilus]